MKHVEREQTADMSKLLYRKRQRREYLKKKSIAYVKVTARLLTLPVCIGVAALAFAGVCMGIDLNPEKHAMALLDMPAAAILASIFVFRLVHSCREEANKASSIPYVPPVTTATLSEEEILVRSTAAPATPDMLLRAAVKSHEAQEGELLRCGHGERP